MPEPKITVTVFPLRPDFSMRKLTLPSFAGTLGFESAERRRGAVSCWGKSSMWSEPKASLIEEFAELFPSVGIFFEEEFDFIF